VPGDLVPAILQLQRGPPRPAAHVEHAPARQADRLALRLGPAPRREEVCGGPVPARVDEAVVPLDDLDSFACLEVLEDQAPVGIVFRSKPQRLPPNVRAPLRGQRSGPPPTRFRPRAGSGSAAPRTAPPRSMRASSA